MRWAQWLVVVGVALSARAGGAQAADPVGGLRKEVRRLQAQAQDLRKDLTAARADLDERLAASEAQQATLRGTLADHNAEAGRLRSIAALVAGVAAVAFLMALAAFLGRGRAEADEPPELARARERMRELRTRIEQVETTLEQVDPSSQRAGTSPPEPTADAAG